jgi:hypothetical protein
VNDSAWAAPAAVRNATAPMNEIALLDLATVITS